MAWPPIRVQQLSASPVLQLAISGLATFGTYLAMSKLQGAAIADASLDFEYLNNVAPGIIASAMGTFFHGAAHVANHSIDIGLAGLAAYAIGNKWTTARKHWHLWTQTAALNLLPDVAATAIGAGIKHVTGAITGGPITMDSALLGRMALFSVGLLPTLASASKAAYHSLTARCTQQPIVRQESAVKSTENWENVKRDLSVITGNLFVQLLRPKATYIGSSLNFIGNSIQYGTTNAWRAHTISITDIAAHMKGQQLRGPHASSYEKFMDIVCRSGKATPWSVWGSLAQRLHPRAADGGLYPAYCNSHNFNWW